ncbi:MAG: nucleotide exchange factor GrpE [Thermodesulfobacteriota bacterium]|nr:nucleotide exchange factor GrpE [Thermodesulfobacteriota bacterium]
MSEEEKKKKDDEKDSGVSPVKQASKKELLVKIEEAEKNASENHDKYLRACAEFDNYKKRAARDREDFIKYGNETLIRDLLPTVDSMERALEHASNSEDFKTFVDGLAMIRDSFLAALGRHGVEEIDAIGKDFDPNFHEAIMQVEGKKKEDNKIVEEFEKGYSLNSRLLRPSKVSISKHVDK